MSEILPQDDEANRRALIEEKLLEGFTVSYRTRIPPVTSGYFHDDTGRTMFRRILSELTPEEVDESTSKTDKSPVLENEYPDKTWGEHDSLRTKLIIQFGYDNVWIGPTLERDFEGNLLPDDYMLIYVRPSGMLRNTDNVIKPPEHK